MTHETVFHMFEDKKGLLIVEAILATVVIAVGLSWTLRSLSNQLKALRTIDSSSTFIRVADAIFMEVESDVREGRSSRLAAEGVVEDSPIFYRWSFATQPTADSDITQVVLTVSSAQGHLASRTLRELWPSSWIPSEWKQ